MVHTCPRCELRFASDAELRYHLDVDHHAEPGAFDRFHYKPAPQRPTGKRYLIVANQTLSDEALFERIKQLASEGDAHFHIVVPATPSEGYGSSTTPDDRGLALANYRARHIVDRLHDEGIEAEAEVSDPEPVKAVARALGHEQADEIILSVKPRGLSRWLDVDLPKQLEHTFHLPVVVVSAGT